jgi:hypothetical protein
MSLIALLAAALAAAPTAAARPRECAACGAYVGPNLELVTDPSLRRIDIWPEFYAASCRFEVARGAFVTLGRAACAAESSYRAGIPGAHARS